MIILDGNKARETLFESQKKKFGDLKNPKKLAIISVGENFESEIYINRKIEYGGRLGVGVLRLSLPESFGFLEFKKTINELNLNEKIGGIIIQLPVGNFSAETVVDLIDPKKDVDGFSSKKIIPPATGRGVMALLDFYKVKVFGKKAVIVGDSLVAGRPIAELLEKNGAEIKICNRQTENIKEETQKAEILVFATGNERFFGCDYLGENKPVIVDVGIKRSKDGKIYGDTDFYSCSDKISALTPVPGGVGPMTVWALFENLYDLEKMPKN